MSDPNQAASRRPFSFIGQRLPRAAVRPAIQSALVAMLELVFPPVCMTCGGLVSTDRRQLCGACVDRIVRIRSPLCVICGKPFLTTGDTDHLCGACMHKSPPFAEARSFGIYGGVLLDAVHLFKYHHRTALSSVLSGLAATHDWGGFNPKRYDIMAPVPLFRRRLYERGFNQAMLLCRGLGDVWGIEVEETSLARTRQTAPQIRLTPAEREKNVRGAFAVTGGAFKGRQVLLVDDVYTTGATVTECTRVLMDAGAEAVGVLTIARVVIT
jgi:ComF family protein